MGLFRPRSVANIVLLCAWEMGCTVGPDYVRPGLDLAPSFPSARTANATVSDDPAGWWRRLGDARLAEAVAKAIKANPNLDIAAARIVQARAALAGVEAASLPIGGAGAIAGRASDSAQGPLGQLLTPVGAPRQSDLYAGALTLGWETDLFGAIRRAHEARSAQLEADIWRREAIKVVVAAQTAHAYVILRGLQQRKDILQRRIAIAQHQLMLARRRQVVGEGAGVGVRGAEAILASMQAAIPALEAGITETLNTLDVLEGAKLGSNRSLLSDPAVLPVQIAVQILDTPAQAVARRPDVAAAERDLAAANAGIGVATAEYYPSLQLSALAGLSSNEVGHLLDSNAGLWAGGAIVQWRLLDWNRIDADVAAAKGRKAEALAAYRGTALSAAAEIDTALEVLETTTHRARRSDDARQAVARTSQILARAHAVGETALEPVLDAQDKACAAEDDLVQARVAALSASIDLYRALGGT